MNWSRFTFEENNRDEDGNLLFPDEIDYTQLPGGNEKFNGFLRREIWEMAFRLVEEESISFSNLEEAQNWYNENYDGIIEKLKEIVA